MSIVRAASRVHHHCCCRLQHLDIRPLRKGVAAAGDRCGRSEAKTPATINVFHVCLTATSSPLPAMQSPASKLAATAAGSTRTSSPPLSRRFWLNFCFLSTVLALAEAARGIVIPTLSLYVASLGGGSLFLSLIVAAFSVGRLLSSGMYGLASDYFSIRSLLLASVTLTVAGHVLFITAAVVPSGPLYLLLLSRALTGFGTGVLSLARSYVARQTSSRDRTRFMSWLGVVQFAGYSSTPIVGAAQVDWTVTGSWTINTYNAGTYCLLILDVAAAVGLWFGLKEPKTEPPPQAVEAPRRASLQLVVPQPVRQSGTPRISVSQPVTPHRTAREGEYSAVENSDEKQEDTTAQADGSSRRHSLSDVEPTVSVPAASEPKEETQLAVTEHDDPYAFVFPSSRPLPTRRGRSVTATSSPARRSSVMLRVQTMPERPRRSSAPAAFHTLARDDLSCSPLPTSSPPPLDEPPPLLRSSSVAMIILHPQLSPFLFVLLNASCRGCLAVAETFGAPLFYSVQYGANYDPATVNSSQAAYFYTALGAGGVLVFILLDSFTRYLSELTLLVCGFTAMSLGFVTTLDFDNDLSLLNLSFSMLCIYCIATPITNTLVSSMLSKARQPAAQGRWMGLLTAAGSIGRIVFPLLSGGLYTSYGTNAALLLPGAVAFVSMLLIVVVWRVWKSWLLWWAEAEMTVEGRVRRRVTDWKESRRRAERADREQLQAEVDDGWLTIDELQQRLQRRVRAKRRWRREFRAGNVDQHGGRWLELTVREEEAEDALNEQEEEKQADDSQQPTDAAREEEETRRE